MKGSKELRIHLGKLVSSENEENWWRPALFEKYTRIQIPDELEIVSPPPKEEQNYNCFVYVLGLQNDTRFLGNENWEFTRKLDELFDKMIATNILKPLKKADIGSLAVYRADNNKISHVGIMESEDSVISKWSWGPVLRHKIFEVPDHYGNNVEFYAISEDVKNFIVDRRETT